MEESLIMEVGSGLPYLTIRQAHCLWEGSIPDGAGTADLSARPLPLGRRHLEKPVCLR